jgi:toxin YoeB
MPYKIKLLPKAEKHYLHWKKHNPGFADKIDELLKAAKADPFSGIGKPEPLKHDLRGYWSRRISEEHRILYKVEGEFVYVHRCYGHYD